MPQLPRSKVFCLGFSQNVYHLTKKEILRGTLKAVPFFFIFYFLLYLFLQVYKPQQHPLSIKSLYLEAKKKYKSFKQPKKLFKT